jgi:hypothetical protein
MPPWDQICHVMSWGYYLVKGGHFGKEEFGFAGFYRLIVLEPEGDLSKPVTLNRVCGQDQSGALYIGESNDLGRRLNELRRSAAHRQERSHMLRRITAVRGMSFRRSGFWHQDRCSEGF